MTLYVDTSALLRVVLGEPDPLPPLRTADRLIVGTPLHRIAGDVTADRRLG